MSKLTIFYCMVAAAIVSLYTYSTAFGWEYGHPTKQETTKEAKKSGYRGSTFIFTLPLSPWPASQS